MGAPGSSWQARWMRGQRGQQEPGAGGRAAGWLALHSVCARAFMSWAQVLSARLYTYRSPTHCPATDQPLSS